MTPAELLTQVRAKLAALDLAGHELAFETFVLLERLSGAGPLLSSTYDVLDAFAPSGRTFLQWLNGAQDAFSEGDWVGLTYRCDRTRAEILALLGKAALKASRSEAA